MVWAREGTELFAPALWSYEAVSSVRKFVASGMLTQRDASIAVRHLMALGIRSVAPTVDLHQSALAWAERLNDFVAYDPAYLAVAEELGAPFWTVDSKLVKRARAIGVDWIYDLVEPS